MLTEKELERVHKRANKKLYAEYPLLDMADTPEGHWKKWEIKWIIEAYIEEKGERND